jgi:hypothetical protein
MNKPWNEPGNAGQICCNRMKNDEITNALTAIQPLLNRVTKDWMLIGTTSLYLQGYALNPKDVDILCSTNDVDLINKKLLAYQKPVEENLSQDKFRSLFSRYNLDGIVIELMGNLEVKTATGWVNVFENIKQIEIVLFHDLIFKVPSKADQIMIYNLFNREKDIHALKLLNAT